MEAERRQITVLFTDMVGFTTFSERAGEEAAFALMASLMLSDVRLVPEADICATNDPAGPSVLAAALLRFDLTSPFHPRFSTAF